MESDYIQELNEAYDRFFLDQNHSMPILTIDSSDLDFVRSPDDLEWIENRIRQALQLPPFQPELPMEWNNACRACERPLFTFSTGNPDMRITRDTLLKAAKTFVQQQTYRDRDIVCVYLSGSLIDDLPLLGGTADIDLFFIHDEAPRQPREIIQLTPDIHLDLAHHDQSIYNQPRELRLDPWIGSYLIKDPIVLYATQHWFEFTQATVFSKFAQPENVMRRAIPFAENARQTWLDYQFDPQAAGYSHGYGATCRHWNRHPTHWQFWWTRR